MASTKQVIELVIKGDSTGAEKEVKKLGQQIQKLGGSLSKFGDAATMYITLPLAAAAVASIKAASDIAEAVNKVEVVFEDSAASVKKFASSAAKNLGMSERAALEAAGTYGNLFTAFGLTEESAAEMSTTMVQLAADLASFNNTSVDDALEALRSGLSGEAEPLKRFGIDLREAVLQQEALNQGIWDGTGTLNSAQRAQAAYAVIMQQTTKAQGDFARTADGMANSQKTAKAQLEDMAATIGAKVLPIATQLVGTLASMLDKFNSLSPAQQDMILKLGLVAAAIGPVFSVAGRLVSTYGALLQVAPQVGVKMAEMAVKFGTVEAATATLNSATLAAQGGYLALAAAAGFAIGTLVNQIPAIKETASQFAALAGEVDSLNEYLERAANQKKPWWAYTPVGAGVYATQAAAGAAGYEYARRGYGEGGVVTMPEIAQIGERGYAEYVISTEPRYRDRSRGLYEKLGASLGVRPFTMPSVALAGGGTTSVTNFNVSVNATSAADIPVIRRAVEDTLRAYVRNSSMLGRTR